MRNFTLLKAKYFHYTGLWLLKIWLVPLDDPAGVHAYCRVSQRARARAVQYSLVAVYKHPSPGKQLCQPPYGTP